VQKLHCSKETFHTASGLNDLRIRMFVLDNDR